MAKERRKIISLTKEEAILPAEALRFPSIKFSELKEYAEKYAAVQTGKKAFNLNAFNTALNRLSEGHLNDFEVTFKKVFETPGICTGGLLQALQVVPLELTDEEIALLLITALPYLHEIDYVTNKINEKSLAILLNFHACMSERSYFDWDWDDFENLANKKPHIFELFRSVLLAMPASRKPYILGFIHNAPRQFLTTDFIVKMSEMYDEAA